MFHCAAPTEGSWRTGKLVRVLTIDAADKADSVITFLHKDFPVYDRLKDGATKGIPGL